MNKTHIKFGKAIAPQQTITTIVKRTDKFNKMLMIYLGGYATWKPFTLSEWFEARDYINERKNLIPKF